jgi:hypothetical protein
MFTLVKLHFLLGWRKTLKGFEIMLGDMEKTSEILTWKAIEYREICIRCFAHWTV